MLDFITGMAEKLTFNEHHKDFAPKHCKDVNAKVNTLSNGYLANNNIKLKSIDSSNVANSLKSFKDKKRIYLKPKVVHNEVFEKPKKFKVISGSSVATSVSLSSQVSYSVKLKNENSSFKDIFSKKGNSKKKSITFNSIGKSKSGSQEEYASTKFENGKSLKFDKKQAHSLEAQKKRYFFFFPMNRSRLCEVEGDKPFKCHICEKLYKYIFSLKRHFLRIHINETYISEADLLNCKIIDNVGPKEKIKDPSIPGTRKRVKPTGNFLYNNEGREMPGLYKCSFHEVKYDLENELREHYATVFHPKKEEFFCKICKEVFDTKCKLNDHSKSCPPNVGNVRNHCKKCKVTFQSEVEYEYHLTIHGNGKFCKYCNKEFSNIANRKRHENLHEGSQTFKCKHCDFSSLAKKDLNIHIRKAHMDLYLRCEKCPKFGIAKIYATEDALQAHMVERHGEKETSPKPASVSKIDKLKPSPNKKVPKPVFKTPELKPMSKKIHLPPSLCSLCKKAFPDVRAMLRHKNIAHKKRTTYKRKVKKTFKAKPKVLQKKPTKKEREEEEIRFYLNISDNIAENMLKHIDGTVNQLSLRKDDISKRASPNPESWNKDFSMFGSSRFSENYTTHLNSKDISSNAIEDSISPKIFIATGLNKIIDCTLETSAFHNSGFKSFKELCNVNLGPKCVCHFCLPPPKSFEEKLKMIEYKKLSVYMCSICKEHFQTKSYFAEHCYNNHPDIECTLIVIEGENDQPPVIPTDLLRKERLSPTGILSDKLDISKNTHYISTLPKCTKCNACVSLSIFHEHILTCAGSETYDIKRHCRKHIPRKRIKRTMKHRIDLDSKQMPSKEQNKSDDQLFDKTVWNVKSPYGKNDFNVKTNKTVKKKYYTIKENTPPCSFCHKKFPSQAHLKNHQCAADKLKKVKKSSNSIDQIIESVIASKSDVKENSQNIGILKKLSFEKESKKLADIDVKNNGNETYLHVSALETSHKASLKNDLVPHKPNHEIIGDNCSEFAIDLTINKNSPSQQLNPKSNFKEVDSSPCKNQMEKSPIDALKETVDKLVGVEKKKYSSQNEKKRKFSSTKSLFYFF